MIPVLMLLCEIPSEKDFSNEHQDEPNFHLHDNVRRLLPIAYFVKSSYLDVIYFSYPFSRTIKPNDNSFIVTYFAISAFILFRKK